MLRRRGKGCAALAAAATALLPTAAAHASTAATTVSLAPGLVEWQLVGADGMALELSIPAWRDRCGRPNPTDRLPVVQIAAADRTQINLSVSLPPDPSPAADEATGEPLPCPAMAYGPGAPFTVSLPVVLRGQSISGPGRTDRVFTASEWSSASGLRAVAPGRFAAPSVVGLRLPDAMRVLTAAGVTKKQISFRGGRRGVVVSQTKPGTAMPAKGKRIRLTVLSG